PDYAKIQVGAFAAGAAARRQAEASRMKAGSLITALAALAACVTLAERPAADGVLQGRVADARGQPLQDAIVVLTAAPAGPALRPRSKRDGSYLFPNLQPGIDYDVRADYEGLASTAHPFRISNPGEKVGFDLIVGARIRFQDVASQAGIDFVQRNGA